MLGYGKDKIIEKRGLRSRFFFGMLIVVVSVLCVFVPERVTTGFGHGSLFMWADKAPFTPHLAGAPAAGTPEVAAFQVIGSLEKLFSDVSRNNISNLEIGLDAVRGASAPVLKVDPARHLTDRQIQDIVQWLATPELKIVNCGILATRDLLLMKGIHKTPEEIAALTLTVDLLGGGMTSGRKDLKISIYAIGEVIRAWGLSYEALQVSLGDVFRLPRPFIAHLKRDHFVLVTGVEGGDVLYHDAGTPMRMSRSQFENEVSGYVLSVRPGADAIPGYQLMGYAAQILVRGDKFAGDGVSDEPGGNPVEEDASGYSEGTDGDGESYSEGDDDFSWYDWEDWGNWDTWGGTSIAACAQLGSATDVLTASRKSVGTTRASQAAAAVQSGLALGTGSSATGGTSGGSSPAGASSGAGSGNTGSDGAGGASGNTGSDGAGGASTDSNGGDPDSTWGPWTPTDGSGGEGGASDAAAGTATVKAAQDGGPTGEASGQVTGKLATLEGRAEYWGRSVQDQFARENGFRKDDRTGLYWASNQGNPFEDKNVALMNFAAVEHMVKTEGEGCALIDGDKSESTSMKLVYNKQTDRFDEYVGYTKDAATNKYIDWHRLEQGEPGSGKYVSFTNAYMGETGELGEINSRPSSVRPALTMDTARLRASQNGWIESNGGFYRPDGTKADDLLSTQVEQVGPAQYNPILVNQALNRISEQNLKSYGMTSQEVSQAFKNGWRLSPTGVWVSEDGTRAAKSKEDTKVDLIAEQRAKSKAFFASAQTLYKGAPRHNQRLGGDDSKSAFYKGSARHNQRLGKGDGKSAFYKGKIRSRRLGQSDEEDSGSGKSGSIVERAKEQIAASQELGNIEGLANSGSGKDTRTDEDQGQDVLAKQTSGSGEGSSGAPASAVGSAGGSDSSAPAAAADASAQDAVGESDTNAIAQWFDGFKKAGKSALDGAVDFVKNFGSVGVGDKNLDPELAKEIANVCAVSDTIRFVAEKEINGKEYNVLLVDKIPSEWKVGLYQGEKVYVLPGGYAIRAEQVHVGIANRQNGDIVSDSTTLNNGIHLVSRELTTDEILKLDQDLDKYAKSAPKGSDARAEKASGASVASDSDRRAAVSIARSIESRQATASIARSIESRQQGGSPVNLSASASSGSVRNRVDSVSVPARNLENRSSVPSKPIVSSNAPVKSQWTSSGALSKGSLTSNWNKDGSLATGSLRNKVPGSVSAPVRSLENRSSIPAKRIGGGDIRSMANTRTIPSKPISSGTPLKSQWTASGALSKGSLTSNWNKDGSLTTGSLRNRWNSVGAIVSGGMSGTSSIPSKPISSGASLTSQWTSSGALSKGSLTSNWNKDGSLTTGSLRNKVPGSVSAPVRSLENHSSIPAKKIGSGDIRSFENTRTMPSKPISSGTPLKSQWTSSGALATGSITSNWNKGGSLATGSLRNRVDSVGASVGGNLKGKWDSSGAFATGSLKKTSTSSGAFDVEKSSVRNNWQRVESTGVIKSYNGLVGSPLGKF